MMKSLRKNIWMWGSVIAMILLFVLLLFTGPVHIPSSDIMALLSGGEASEEYYGIILFDSRLPMAVCAACCGASLSVAGLVMQAVFQNPLAGPSVLGVSSGASLGVAVVMLGSACGIVDTGGLVSDNLLAFGGAVVGAAVIIVILMIFSTFLKSGVMLLIVGIMISYLSSSMISLLNYLAPAEGIKSYLIWGLGSFSGVRSEQLPLYLILSATALMLSMTYIKPLNALLLGERYAGSMGYSIGRLRFGLLAVTGTLVAVSTAYCGPIGFIGMIVPHLCRMALCSSSHVILMPACVFFGASVTMACAWLSVIDASGGGVIPINVITPLVGVPVILYILMRRDRLNYFN